MPCLTTQGIPVEFCFVPGGHHPGIGPGGFRPPSGVAPPRPGGGDPVSSTSSPGTTTFGLYIPLSL